MVERVSGYGGAARCVPGLSLEATNDAKDGNRLDGLKVRKGPGPAGKGREVNPVRREISGARCWDVVRTRT